MSDDYRRFLEQQEALKRMLKPLEDLQRYIDPVETAYKDLGINTATMQLLQQEAARQKMLSSLIDVDRATQIAQDFDRQRELLEGSAEEAKRFGLLNPQFDTYSSVKAAIEAHLDHERMFRLPAISELTGIAHKVMAESELVRKVLRTEDHLKTAMEAMHHPWLQANASFSSASALSEIIAIGRGISDLPAYDSDFSAGLRSNLGDWRDTLTIVPEPLINPIVRSAFYIERGFNPELTDFTTVAFDEGLQIAGLSEPAASEGEDNQEVGFSRAREAFDRLLRFEVALRRFIERVMQAEFGSDWMKRQLPNGMFDSWVAKRETAVKAGYLEQPLIDYADFTDYKTIIERRDNWKAVFAPIFGRTEDIRESFQRMYPVRIATMHARFITPDDRLLLLVETNRVLKAIGGNT
jgi:hypothetical protein